MTQRLQVGNRVKFTGERQAYTVQAANQRFAVCTKPFNPRRSVLYSIVDFERSVRGTEDLIFCMGFETRQQCDEALDRLATGESEVSYRNNIPLDIEHIAEGRSAMT